jgi:2-oxoglutarate dehydrogenase complex dehydrogenase (E1) component-like enzyme
MELVVQALCGKRCSWIRATYRAWGCKQLTSSREETTNQDCRKVPLVAVASAVRTRPVQVYYLLAHARRGRGVKDVALLRLEQIAPFPFDRVAMRISQYPNAELCWVQVSS